jgi:hypothetical protein
VQRTQPHHLVTGGTAIAAVLCLGVASAIHGGDERDLGWLRSTCNGGGAVAWHQKPQSDITLFDVGAGETRTIGQGGRHEFSPDGSKIAWLDGGTAKGCLWKQSPEEVHNIIAGCDYACGVHWVSDTEVVVNKNDTWLKVHLSGSPQTEIPELSALGKVEFEGDVKLCGDGVWSWISGGTWKTSDGNTGASPGACSRSLSPDGRSVTGLRVGHDQCDLVAIRDGGVSGSIGRTLVDCGSKGFDNHRWSSGAARFIVAQWECENRVGVWEVETSDVCVVGSCGGETYGDVTSGDGSGAAWPDAGPAAPEAILDVTELTFSAVAGAEDPAAKSLVVYTEAGEMNEVSVGDTPPWLSVSTSAADGNEITLTTTPMIDGLTPDTYSATIMVTTTNAGSVSYTVTLTVTAIARPPAIELSSPDGGESYTAGQTVTITWEAVEDSLPRGVNLFVSPDEGKSWLPVNTGNSIEPSDGRWESYSWNIPAAIENVSLISTSALVKVEDYDEGSGRMDVSDGVFSITAPSALPVRLNCGGALHPVAGWEDDAAYAAGGTAYDFGSDGEIAGIATAAPAAVYRTCRHRVSGQETGFTYTIPSLPDGEYVVRLHFADRGSRSIDVSIEGERLVHDLDITDEAGGSMQALVIEKQVAVSGGSLRIALDDDRSSPVDVLINGIEVMRTGLTAGSGFDSGSRTHARGALDARVVAGGAIRIEWSLARPHTLCLRSLDGRVVMRTGVTGAMPMLLEPGDLPSGYYIVEALREGGGASIALPYVAGR